RVVLGAFQSVLFPACYALVAKWTPEHERSVVLSLPLIGGNIGTIVTSALTGYLTEEGFAGGWPSVFYVSAIMTSVLMLIWIVLVQSEPHHHRWMTHNELKIINPVRYANINNNVNSKTTASNGIAGVPAKQRTSVPWLKIFTSLPVLSLIVVKFTINWISIMFLLKLPSYLKVVFNYSAEQNGFINAGVNVTVPIGLFIGGYVSDYLISKKHYDKTLIRKIFQSLATFGSAACLAVIPLGVFLYGLRGGGDVPVDADMTLQYVGTVFAIANSIAFTCGIITPLVIGVIVGDGTEHVRRQWAYVFYMSAALNVFGGLVFVVFGSAKQQEWDKQPVRHSIELSQ
ncbi:unnamed protein product, partial [Medioppia subpectinata]